MARVRKAKQVLEKTPGEIRKVDMEFGADISGATISSVTSVTISPAAQLTETHTFSGTQVELKLSAGNAGTTYEVVVRVVTSDSETVDGSMDVVVGDA